MATYAPHSHSPRALPHNPSPITPVHSPHHSITSSVSSRTPLHTLSIHEYRRQLNTPSSQTATPAGKTLRRKPAAPSLAGLERVPSFARATHSASRPSFHPLHSSQSAQQLHSRPSPFQSQLLSDHISRSQSAEPRTQGGSISSTSTTTSTGKVCHFNSRKRLPKPAAARANTPIPPHLTAPRYPQFPTALEFSKEDLHSSDTHTTRTTSSFSLSRFPQPPHLEDRSLFLPRHESELAHVTASNFASTAPATPPATPATIHYRGASFDLVNPHDSLLLHDIVTPSREIGSSEYLPVQSFDESFANSAEMAPKRPLYGDLSAAHAGIMRRAESSSSSLGPDLPISPTPAVISPNSSTYTSPTYSLESDLAPSPLDVKKPRNDSRFSLKHLTRTLTKRLSKSPQYHHGQELQELGDPKLQFASISIEGNFPRPLTQTYSPKNQPAYFPISPASPITPTSPMSPQEQALRLVKNDGDKSEGRRSVQRYNTEPLTSLIPDDYSSQVGRGDDPPMSMSDGHLHARPYYDDLDSIYPSSSIYTADDQRKSYYQQSLTDNRISNDLPRSSGMDVSTFGSEYGQDNLHRYSIYNYRKSKNQPHEMDSHSAVREKTDTISKIIEQYDPVTPAASTSSQEVAEHGVLPGSDSSLIDKAASSDIAQGERVTSGIGQFEFGLLQDVDGAEQNYNVNMARHNQGVFARKPAIARDLGSPPRAPAPLAPPFQYNDESSNFAMAETSDIFSNQSVDSYGDTRNLLQMTPAKKSSFLLMRKTLQPSSSYSQPQVKPLETSSSYSQPETKPLEPSSSYPQSTDLPSPRTPQEALDEAEQIFHGPIRNQQASEKGIPAMWMRRTSGSMLLNKSTDSQPMEHQQTSDCLTVDQEMARENEEADWVSDDTDSTGSFADYSSSEGGGDDLGLSLRGSLPSWAERQPSLGPSIYSHPSPIRAHHNPFSSSPPQLPHSRIHTAPLSSSPPVAYDPRPSTTVPAFRLSTRENVLGESAFDQQYTPTPWTNQYEFSDKETQELLASGPNDKIIFDYRRESTNAHGNNVEQSDPTDTMFGSSSPMGNPDHAASERENTFAKLCAIGPKGNLTGTPNGTGMHQTGSSLANNSSPGLAFSSSAARADSHSSDYPGFYAAPFDAVGSVTRIEQRSLPAEPEHERSVSEVTLFPKPSDFEGVESSPAAGASHRQSLRYSTTFERSQRRTSRTAVPGQTKLRQMVLTPETGRKTVSSADTNFSRFLNGSERPSTSQTNTPLRPEISVDTVPSTFSPVRTLIAHQNSPHLLCPERAVIPEDEERRRKLSWVILAVFCLLPPCIILFRVWGDSIIASLTKGHLGHCTAKSKKAALIGGIAINVGIATAIVVPIVVVHALGMA